MDAIITMLILLFCLGIMGFLVVVKYIATSIRRRTDQAVATGILVYLVESWKRRPARKDVN